MQTACFRLLSRGETETHTYVVVASGLQLYAPAPQLRPKPAECSAALVGSMVLLSVRGRPSEQRGNYF